MVHREPDSFEILGSAQGDINHFQVTAPTVRRWASSVKAPAARFDDDAVCAMYFGGHTAPRQVGNSAEPKWKTAGGCMSITLDHGS